MSTVIFDAPQSVGDELMGNEAELELEAVASTADDLYATPADAEEELVGFGIVPSSVMLPTTTGEPVATEVSGDPLQVVSQPLMQPVRETSVDHYESERSNEADLLDQIWNAERDCRKAEARVELLKEELKEAKSQYEQAVIRLREIISDSSGHDAARTTKVIVTPVAGFWDKIEVPASACGETTPASDETKPAEPETTAPLAWRAVPLSELFREPIKGLGAKKQEAMIDLCPTLGALEDLRATVGQAASQFHELLPKGIGLETASTIEERLLDWIARNPKACEDGPIPEPTLQTRADQLCDDPAGFIHRHHGGNGYWQSGFDSFHAGATLDECPWTAGVEQDDWLRGWLRAQGDCAEEKAEGEPASEMMTLEDDEPEVEPQAKTETRLKSEPRVLQASSLDDL